MNDRSYPNRPHVAVGVVVLSTHNTVEHVLLIQRGKPPRMGQWSIPGGAQHVGETLHQTAKREVLEETGLDIDVGGFVEALDYIDKDENNEVRHHYTLIDFWASAPISMEPKAGEDAVQAKWVPIKELNQYEMWNETVRIITKSAHMSHAE